MTRDMDALAEALERAQADRPSWLARLARRVLAKVAGPLIAGAVLAIVLAKVGADLGWLLMAMFYAAPFMAVAVASFIAHAWRRNTGLTYMVPTSQVDLATEPDLASQARAGQVTPDTAGHLAKPTQPATVTVTVLPGPVAALPQAAGQTAPIHYPTRDAEEETR